MEQGAPPRAAKRPWKEEREGEDRFLTFPLTGERKKRGKDFLPSRSKPMSWTFGLCIEGGGKKKVSTLKGGEKEEEKKGTAIHNNGRARDFCLPTAKRLEGGKKKKKGRDFSELTA